MSRLDEIKARLDAATPGPWNVWDGPEYEGGGADLCIGAGKTWLANVDHRLTSAHTTCNPFDGWHQEGEADVCSFNQMEFVTAEQRANANLIAAAPSDLRYLIAEVERMRGALEDLTDTSERAVAASRAMDREIEQRDGGFTIKTWEAEWRAADELERSARIARAALGGGSDGDR